MNQSLLQQHSVYESISEEDVFTGQMQLSEVQVKEFIQNRRGWPLFQQVTIS